MQKKQEINKKRKKWKKMQIKWNKMQETENSMQNLWRNGRIWPKMKENAKLSQQRTLTEEETKPLKVLGKAA